MNIKKSILKVFSVNLFQLLSSIIVGFFIPSILSIEGYANLKTYSLYISYIGLLHFGYLDGLYIKYGGKKMSEINQSVLKGEHFFLIIMELIISMVLLIIAYFLHNIVLLIFGISILPIMLQMFHKSLYQAIGDFENYSKISYIYTISYTILNIILVFVFKNSNYIMYCLTILLANVTSVLVFEYKFLKRTNNRKVSISIQIINNIKVGFFILLGNLSVVALFGIDKWFVKLFLDIDDFAYYSFAVSMLNIINVLVSAISITFYNYLFENNNEKKVQNLKDYLITLGGFSSFAFFPLSFIVNTFLNKYIPSLDIIAITFSVFPYMILINALYVNLYKINKDEKHYFKVVISILLISIAYNIIAVVLCHNTISIAFATILTLMTWVIYSSKDLRNVTMNKKSYFYLLFITIFFIVCAHYLNWLIGGIVYLIGYLLLTLLINQKVLVDLKKMLINCIIKKREQ